MVELFLHLPGWCAAAPNSQSSPLGETPNGGESGTLISEADLEKDPFILLSWLTVAAVDLWGETEEYYQEASLTWRDSLVA